MSAEDHRYSVILAVDEPGPHSILHTYTEDGRFDVREDRTSLDVENVPHETPDYADHTVMRLSQDELKVVSFALAYILDDRSYGEQAEYLRMRVEALIRGEST